VTLSQSFSFVELLLHARKRVWKRLKWSFTALYYGTWPQKDDLGRHLGTGTRTLAGGYRAIHYLLNGDLDYLAKSLKLPYCFGTEMCCWCPANLTNIPWWDLKPGAEWSKQLYTAFTVLAGVCAIFEVPGVSLMTVAPDWMHNKHLGTDQYFYGSVLWLLVYVILDDTPTNNLDGILDDIREEYANHGIASRFQNITLSNFTEEQSPHQ
jgi:hypothetical protein